MKLAEHLFLQFRANRVGFSAYRSGSGFRLADVACWICIGSEGVTLYGNLDLGHMMQLCFYLCAAHQTIAGLRGLEATVEG